MPRLERRGILDLSGHDRAKKPALAEPPATDQDLNPGDRVEGLGKIGKPTGEFGTEPGKQERVEKLNIGDLDPMERERFSKQWESVQSRFVDSPRGAAAEADDLVSSLMKIRGYPVSDFDQRAADISVDHPRIVDNYRSAHEIALRVGKDEASTEDLRTAMIHYRSLCEELMQVPTIVERKEVA
jgi:hypothetical protein